MRDTGLRGVANPTPDPGRFRCLVCRKVVTGTPSGHCPQCGFVPPKTVEIPMAEPKPHPLAVAVWLTIALLLGFGVTLALVLR